MNRIAAQRIIAGSRGNSSVGRARPCQGRGREFESRFPLQVFETPAMPGSVVSGPRKAVPVGTSPRTRGRAVPVTGQVAEWSCSGLQIRVRRFDSDPGLQMRCRVPGCDHWIRACSRRAQSDRQKPANAYLLPTIRWRGGHAATATVSAGVTRSRQRGASVRMGAGLRACVGCAQMAAERNIILGRSAANEDPSIRIDGAAWVRRGGDWIKTSGFDDVDRMAADDASIPMFFSHCREIQPCSRTMPV